MSSGQRRLTAAITLGAAANLTRRWLCMSASLPRTTTTLRRTGAARCAGSVLNMWRTRQRMNGCRRATARASTAFRRTWTIWLRSSIPTASPAASIRRTQRKSPRCCANQGAILGDVYNSDHGPAWACGYSGQSSGEWVNVSSCTMGGYVGSYTTYKDNPTSAPAATVHNAFPYKNDEYYDPTINN